MIDAELSELLMKLAIGAIIVGGFLLGLDPMTCAIVLLIIVGGLYVAGRP